MRLNPSSVPVQAGLVIANAQSGTLADGWVEYLDQSSNKHYYYNVHTKATTWTKPSKSRAPPPPPLPRASLTGGGDAAAGAAGASAPPAVARRGSSRRSSTGGNAVGSTQAMEVDGAAANTSAWAAPTDEGSDGADSSRLDSARSASGGPVRHSVADAIATRATKMKMVEAVQLECSLAPRHGPAGLVSVRL